MQETGANVTITGTECITGRAWFVVGCDHLTCLTDPPIGGPKPRDDLIPGVHVLEVGARDVEEDGAAAGPGWMPAVEGTKKTGTIWDRGGRSGVLRIWKDQVGG